jgi:hypothetical protein
MPPKPFPYPIGIGIDVCQPIRVLKLLTDSRTLNHWLMKVFNRLEWPALRSRFKLADNVSPHIAEIGALDEFLPVSVDGEQSLILRQPWRPTTGSTLNNAPAVTSALAQHLAGRYENPHELSTEGSADRYVSLVDVDGRRRKQLSRPIVTASSGSRKYLSLIREALQSPRQRKEPLST